jgi:hypothetical protein
MWDMLVVHIQMYNIWICILNMGLEIATQMLQLKNTGDELHREISQFD